MHKGRESAIEDNMRKLCLMLAAGLAVLSTAALPNRAEAMQPRIGNSYRFALEENVGSASGPTAMVEQVRMVCTHFWNGRWHHREYCFWQPRHRHHNRGHHGRY